MSQFIEERLPVCINYGASFSQQPAVQITKTAGGNEYRSLRHPFVQLAYDVAYERPAKFIREQILDLYHRCNGTFRGFRLKDFKDYTTNNYVDPPTALDQPMQLVNLTIPDAYQLMRWYGDPADKLCARRRIRKPVADTVLVGVGGEVLPATQWSVDNTTGIVTMAANKVEVITAISKGASTVLEVGSNTFVVGESVVITGVAGMTQINGRRAQITAKPTSTSITVAINSALFSDYVSGGSVQTNPVDGESVTGGCEFDIPCRFGGELDASFSNLDFISADGITVVEILNP